jgi:hypothetical protein
VGQDAMKVGQAEGNQDAGEADDDPGLGVERIEPALLGFQFTLDLVAEQREGRKRRHNLQA